MCVICDGGIRNGGARNWEGGGLIGVEKNRLGIVFWCFSVDSYEPATLSCVFSQLFVILGLRDVVYWFFFVVICLCLVSFVFSIFFIFHYFSFDPYFFALKI